MSSSVEFTKGLDQEHLWEYERRVVKFLTNFNLSDLEQLMKDLESLAAEKAALEEKLGSGTLPFEELQSASERIGQIMELTDEKELRWLELSENLFLDSTGSVLFKFATGKEEVRCSLILREAVISHFAWRADFSVMTQGGFDDGEVTFHFLYMTSYLNPDTFSCRNRMTVFHIQTSGHAGCLKFAIDNPASQFIHQCSLNSPVQSLEPTLIVIS